MPVPKRKLSPEAQHCLNTFDALTVGRKIDADLNALHSLTDRALATGGTGGLMAATVYHLEARKLLRGIRFRCIFCGKEHDTVEECNACEESH